MPPKHLGANGLAQRKDRGLDRKPGLCAPVPLLSDRLMLHVLRPSFTLKKS